MALKDVLRNAQRGTEFADLVLEELCQRLQHFPLGLKFEDFRDPVVVGLDDGSL